MKIRALSANIFKSIYGDCSNGGISSRFDKVFIECHNGPHEFDTDNLPENFVRLSGDGYRYARPAVHTNDGCVGWMFGGCLIYTSDSRFPSDYPLMLNDRQETRREYDLLSR